MSKRGTTMVEAALVFPLVILTVTALIYMLVFFYQLTETGAEMHMALRAESGRISDTAACMPQVEARFPVYRRAKEIYYLGNMTFTETGILKKLEKQLSARKYTENEAEFVRTMDFLKEKERAGDE